MRVRWWKVLVLALAAVFGLCLGVSVAGGTLWLAGLVSLSGSADAAPRVVSVSMAPGGVLSVRFSRRVRAGVKSFTLACPRGHPQKFALTFSPAFRYRLTPRRKVPTGTLCQVTVYASGIRAVDRLGPPRTMKKDFKATVRVPPTPPTTTSTSTGSTSTGSTSTGSTSTGTTSTGTTTTGPTNHAPTDIGLSATAIAENQP